VKSCNDEVSDGFYAALAMVTPRYEAMIARGVSFQVELVTFSSWGADDTDTKTRVI
jgi:hypothetical protein